MVETPMSTFQEFSEFINWEFQNENGYPIGQDKAGHYISYNSKLDLLPIPSNGTYIPPNTLLTGVNFPLYAAFYAFTHNSLPFYVPPNLYDVVIAF